MSNILNLPTRIALRLQHGKTKTVHFSELIEYQDIPNDFLRSIRPDQEVHRVAIAHFGAAGYFQQVVRIDGDYITFKLTA